MTEKISQEDRDVNGELSFDERVACELAQKLLDLQLQNEELRERLDKNAGLPAANAAMMDAIQHQGERLEIVERERDEALKVAAHDAMTQFLRREPFLQELELKYLAAKEQSETRRIRQGAVLFIDLNKLKAFNTEYGYLAADQIITEFADRLRNCLRPYDLKMRYAGDEFVLYMHDADPNQVGHTIAKRVMESLKQKPIIVDDTIGKSHQIDLTFGVGVARIPKTISREEETTIANNLLTESSEYSKVAKEKFGGESFSLGYKNDQGEIVFMEMNDLGNNSNGEDKV